jgi:DNA-binding NtrC family response regulator
MITRGKLGQLECVDMNSTNGTCVDGTALAGGATLLHGSVIRAGDTVFVVSERSGRHVVEEHARRCASTSFRILLQGETGTGKEVIARLIHAHSGRSGAFVGINCATLSKDLIAAELFGHAKGAFSGAANVRAGLFRAAEGGTLFLDEIGDLPLELQSALLRVLEEQRVRPVGSDQDVPIDVRVIAATHVDLVDASAKQQFRNDLYARLAQVVLTLPPLRERREEILSLAAEFSKGATFTANAAEALVLWNWPRNVRELRGMIEVAAVLGRNPGQIHLADLHAQVPALAEPIRARRSGGATPPFGAQAHQSALRRREELLGLLLKHNGNVTHIAERLGKPRAQIYRWAKALGIDTAQFRR